MTNPAKMNKKNRDKNLTFRGIILPFSLKKRFKIQQTFLDTVHAINIQG